MAGTSGDDARSVGHGPRRGERVEPSSGTAQRERRNAPQQRCEHDAGRQAHDEPADPRIAGGDGVVRRTPGGHEVAWRATRARHALVEARRDRVQGTAIIDTRSDAEYYGEAVRAKRGGAIPGAIHLEWTKNLGPDGAFKTKQELRAMYESCGVTPDKQVLTYCQGGYRAAHAYLALRILGYPNTRNYTGSWKEWGDREDLPIEHPSR